MALTIHVKRDQLGEGPRADEIAKLKLTSVRSVRKAKNRKLSMFHSTFMDFRNPTGKPLAQ